ncbi:MAG: M23 family metallopeptidase, partial [Bacillota bacterium]|nr:M23 family metallopeptidase [Bacillota bacterium]
LAAQEVAIQKVIKMEQNRQAEAARKAAAAEAARRAAEAAAAHSSSRNGSSDQSGNGPVVSSGNFTRPAAGVISSGYGPRVLSSVAGDFHYGVDIANHGDNVPIVAAADGVVAVSHYSQSYGNVVYITHSINGEIFTTVYAHMRMSMVSAGAIVSKGQQIGIMGSTGEAIGQHLHFELYRGPWRYHSAINPVGIVPL